MTPILEPIQPSIRKQLIDAVNHCGLMRASYHLDRLRATIDTAKCQKANGDDHMRRGSLVRKITAQRYYELRRTWNMLTS